MTALSERVRLLDEVCPRQRRLAGDITWTFRMGGSGDPVLLLSGGAGIAVGWLDLILALHDRNRLVALDYPHTNSFQQLAEGVLALLDAERLGAVHVVGQSAGGMLAEVLSRRAPQRVRSMVLTGTGLYGEEDRARLTTKRAEIIATTPEKLRRAARESLRSTWRDSDDADFWIDAVDATLVGEHGKQRMVGSYDAMLGLIDDLPSRQSAPAWAGPTMILRSDDDPLITATHTARLVDMHPDAELRRYSSGGHSLLLTRPDAYSRDVRDFLASVSGPDRSGGSSDGTAQQPE